MIEKRHCNRSAMGAGNRISGYAAVFYDGTPGTEFGLWEGAVERLDRSVFDRALKEGDDVRALFNHDPSLLLGRSPNTLKLSTDSVGLKYEIELGDTSLARDVREHVARGDLSGSSFSFAIEAEEWTRETRFDVRTIKSVQLMDVGPVSFPAYNATTVTDRAEFELRRKENVRKARMARCDAMIELIMKLK